MTTVNLCVCGCGKPAQYAIHHITHKHRPFLTEDDYIVKDMGYTTPCWIAVAKGAKSGRRYATTRIAGKQVAAHRAMYLQEVGPIPEGFVLDHLCRQTRCICPDHLEAVTQEVNSQRRKDAKMTPARVKEIRALEGVRGAYILAREYGVVPQTIYHIWDRVTWKNV